MKTTIVTELLWERAQPLFVMVDGVLVRDINARWSKNDPQFSCLYQGRAAQDLSDVAPYLGGLSNHRQILEGLVNAGWGRSWGVYITCDVSFDELRHHLRKFLKVKGGDGQELYFRFYDPRVLRTFLPTCDRDQVKEIFGPVSTFWVEGEAPTTCIAFRQDKGSLQTELINLEK